MSLLFFSLLNPEVDAKSIGDWLKGILEPLEVWEIKRDYSIKEETKPIEKVSFKYRNNIVQAIKPYKEHIKEASGLFNVPESLIGGLIYAESSGIPDNTPPIGKDGKPISSALGLCQIVSKTFREIKSDLKNKTINRRRIIISSDRTDPRTSIIAGTYYLSKQFDHSVKDTNKRLSRTRLDDWCRALKYYYRGRENVNGKNYIKKYIYTDGSKSIDPKEYCNRVLRYTEVLRRYG